MWDHILIQSVGTRKNTSERHVENVPRKLAKTQLLIWSTSKLIKNPKFHFVKSWSKPKVSSKCAVKEVPFPLEMSHTTKFYLQIQNVITKYYTNSAMSKYCWRAFILRLWWSFHLNVWNVHTIRFRPPTFTCTCLILVPVIIANKGDRRLSTNVKNWTILCSPSYHGKIMFYTLAASQ